MSKTNGCKRCGGEGSIGRYAHVANGRCFACGRTSASPFSAPSGVAYDRARCIRGLAAYLDAAATITTAQWSASRAEGNMTDLDLLLASAPADVAARARTAFARMGVTL